MRVRPLAVAVLTGLVATLATTGPATVATAADCGQPTASRLHLDPGTLVIGTTKVGTVDIYWDVRADGCRLTTPKAHLVAPSGGTGDFSMEKLQTVDGVTTYGTRVSIPPTELYNVDAGGWRVDADVSYPTGGISSVTAELKLRRAAKATINATPEPVKKGKTLTTKGTLTRANWETGRYAGYTKQKVELQFKPKGGSYATIKTITSGTGGALRTTVKATKDGCFRFVYRGNGATGKVTSTADCVDVR